MTVVNATLYYNNTAYNAGTTSNFSTDVTIPETITGNVTNISFYWVVNIDGTDYNLTTYN